MEREGGGRGKKREGEGGEGPRGKGKKEIIKNGRRVKGDRRDVHVSRQNEPMKLHRRCTL